MTNEEMLKLIRRERPNQKINSVMEFKLNEHNFFDVLVDMEMPLGNTKIKHCHMTLPYPLSKYNELNEKEKLEYRISTY